ncbi:MULTISPECIES: hypothetical protein [Pseudomonas]|uniref:hypothetical protein n=1 Tax=Pseudomonas TaxID=286 RepID=UPI002362975E|nr:MULTISPECIES: hypothetical protein [Pseudomonas]WJV25577.1 hypothetical protein PSR66_05930 [Pseudomonas chlororaphis]
MQSNQGGARQNNLKPLSSRRNQRPRARLLGWGWGLLLLAGAAVADEPYLQLEARITSEPYQWQLSTGEIIRKGLSDQAARIMVAPREGREDFVLEMLLGRFPVKVPARCWTLPAAKFESCVIIGPREDSGWQREQAEAFERQDTERQHNRDTRVAWAREQVGIKRVPRTIEAALADHRRWLSSEAGRADPGAISCHPLAPVLAAAPSQDSLPRQDMLKGKTEAVAVYAQAARGGNWRAAGGLLDAMLNDEDFESAYVVVAWLIKNEIPAGYYKLGRLMEVTSGYAEREVYGNDRRAHGNGPSVASLRRHAAWLGDPAAQKDLADMLDDEGDEMNATRLRHCAAVQSPAPER